MNKIEQIKFIEDNYPLYTNHTSNRRIRHDFFSKIETELQAYLLGFYAADGNINEKRKTLRIHLQKRDSEIVYLYKDTISPDARVFTIDEHKTTGRNGMMVVAHESFGVDITSSKKVCRKIFHILYDDSNYYLKRKFNKFNYYANTEDVQIITDACNAQKMSAIESNNSSTSSEHPLQDENIC